MIMLLINNKLLDKFLLYPDGTPLIKVDAEKLGKLAVITWKYDSDAEFLQVIYITRHLRSKGVKELWLNMPYIPNARMDRVKEPSEVFTLKYFAETVNSLKFDKVIVLDPHSYVSEALIDNLAVVPPTDYVRRCIWRIKERQQGSNGILLYFPDEGAMKRYQNLAKEFSLPFAFGIKQRDWATGDLIGTKVEGQTEDIAGTTVLIIDDICSKGGTFYYSAKALKELGAGDIYLYVSHCENAILKGQLIESGLMEHIFTTDSIYRAKHPLISVVEP